MGHVSNIAVLGVALGAMATSPSLAQVPVPPPSNAVIVGGQAPAFCWSAPGANWAQNGTTAANYIPGSGVGNAGTIAIPESGLVDANKRAAINFGSAGAVRLRLAIECNAPMQAQLTAQYGRLQNTDALTLPTGMPAVRGASSSATFENYFPYQVEYGFINTVTGAQPPSTTQKVNGSAGYSNPQNGATASGSPPAWTPVITGTQWFTVKRVDVRIDLNLPPLVTGSPLRPVMVAGSYRDQLTMTLTPSL